MPHILSLLHIMESASCETIDNFPPKHGKQGERLPGLKLEICDLPSVTVDGQVFHKGDRVKWLADDGTVVTGTLSIRSDRTVSADGGKQDIVTVRIDRVYVIMDTLKKADSK